MFKVVFIFSLIIILVSCSNNNKANEIKIKGKASIEGVEEIQFRLSPTDYAVQEKEFIAKINKDSTFSITIPSKKDLFGMILGHYYHNIYLSPGDDLYINIVEDTISYTGKGAKRNTYLYKGYEKTGFNGYYGLIRKNRDKSHEELAALAKDRRNKFVQDLDKYSKEYDLSDKFKTFMLINNNVEYDAFFILSSGLMYRRKIDTSLEDLPLIYRKKMTVKGFVDDKNLAVHNYLYNLRSFIFLKASLLRSKDQKDMRPLYTTIMFDSLTGKSKTYAIANWLDMDFQMNRYDTLVYKRFKKEIKDSLALNIIKNSYDKYAAKQKLLGKPLNEEFNLTRLEDDKGNSLTFADMINKHKGKVIFLDIWSLSCGPCRANMPKSNALKKKLKNYPIEFVYITEDQKTDDLWKQVYEVSLTKENHYRFVKGRNARLLKYMNIDWVPDYMIIDKDGSLINFNAMQPANPGLEKELMKYLQ